MYAKTFTFALIAIWAFNACLAAPAPEAKPCGGCGCCSVERCTTHPVSSCIPIHTTHRLIPSSNCGCGGYGGWGNGGWGNGWGNGGWGYGGWGNGCGCGCGGWGNGGWGNGWGNGGWGYGGWGNGCGCGCC